MKKLFKLVLNTIPRPLLIRFSYAVRPLMAFLLRGTTFQDPIDGKKFRSFLPYGYGKQRENVLSPSTLSLERHRLLWLYLSRETDFFSAPKKVLHFAPEQAFYKRFKKLKNLDYTTTDLHSPLADVKADICDLPFEDNSFDIILCNHVLEHIPNDTLAMKELYRILKLGVWVFSKYLKIITEQLLLKTIPLRTLIKGLKFLVNMTMFVCMGWIISTNFDQLVSR